MTAELRESEAFRKRLFDTSRIPIVVMDTQTCTAIDCNSASIEIYGLASLEDLIGKMPIDFSTPTQYDGTPSARKTRLYVDQTIAEGSIDHILFAVV